MRLAVAGRGWRCLVVPGRGWPWLAMAGSGDGKGSDNVKSNGSYNGSGRSDKLQN